MAIESCSHAAKALRDKVFKNADIVNRMFAMCEPGDMLHFGTINRATREALQSYVMGAYNLDRILLSFVPDTDAFRRMQRQTATLISGSQALHFFDRTSDPTIPLDLFLFPGREEEVGDYLVSIGYNFVPGADQLPILAEEVKRSYNPDLRPWRPYTGGKRPYDALRVYSLWDYIKERSRENELLLHRCGILRLYSFERPDDLHSGGSLRVRLFVSSDSPIAAILRYSSSTALLNVISSDNAYSLYPHRTFVKRHHFSIGFHKGDEEPVWNNHLSSNWEKIHYPKPNTKELARDAKLYERWINDTDCWIIPMKPCSMGDHSMHPNDASLQDTLPFDDPVVCSGWSVHPVFDDEDRWHITCTSIVGKSLQYSYVTPMTVQSELDILKCKSYKELPCSCEADQVGHCLWRVSYHLSDNACDNSTVILSVDRQLRAVIASDRKDSDSTPSDLMLPDLSCCLQ